jgi:beta-lactamase class A
MHGFSQRFHPQSSAAELSQPGAEPLALIDRRHFIKLTTLAGGALVAGAPLVADAARGLTLQAQVVSLVKRLRSEGKIRWDEKTSWSVYDFNGRKKLVSVNEEQPRQAASMMKPFVAQAFFYTMSDSGGRLRYTSTIRDTMEHMIRESSNTATTDIMELVSRYNGNQGPRATEYVLKRHAPEVFRQTRIVEYIPANGRTYRNQASARDYSRFLYAQWHRQMPNAAEVLDLMALPNHDRITRGVSSMPSDVRVYDKTGSTAMLCGNMGIIECRDHRGRPRPYTFIGIIEKADRTNYYGRWITNRSNTIRQVSNLVYGYMQNQHRLV